VNIQEYISTGILEAYVLGELSAHERLEVEKNLIQYPVLRQELLRIEEAAESLLMKAAITPRKEVKARLFEKIKVEPKIKEVSMISGSLQMWRLAAAASIALALLSSYMAYNYWNKWRNTESNLSELLAQNQRMAEDYNKVNQRLDKIETDIRVTDNPAFARILMKGTPNAPQSLASVYWNESTQELYLSVQSMRQLSQENQYQLWAIIDGKPVDAGVFDSTSPGLFKMKDIGKGVTTFAVTIEPRGGKASPTLETMQVAGNTVKS
jgi:anti-sigma-K factor RskA